jgi:hypothetical protein
MTKPRSTHKLCAFEGCATMFAPRAGQRYCSPAHRDASAKCPTCRTPTTPNPQSVGREGGGRYCGDCSRRREAHRTVAKYGITLDEYERRAVEQGGVCAICQQSESAAGNHGGVRRLTVDHDHATGVVRGLLCSRCNVAIGMLDDDPERFVAAAEYLRSAR